MRGCAVDDKSHRLDILSLATVQSPTAWTLLHSLFGDFPSELNRYNLKDMTWQTIVDTVVVGAMGPPGGGRNHITPRLLRHFNILCFLEFDDSTLTRIFKTIVDWHFGLNKVSHHETTPLLSLGSFIQCAVGLALYTFTL